MLCKELHISFMEEEEEEEVKAKTTNQPFLNRFGFKKLYMYLRNKGGRSIHFLEALLKTYSKINDW